MERLTEYDVYPIPVKDIFYDTGFNCRGTFTPQSVKDLADSIEQNGLQFPVVVQPWDGGDGGGHPWRLLAGHRRFIAYTTFLKRLTIPASVRYDLTPRQASMLNFTENLERKDLSIMEEARALANLYPEGVSLRVAATEIKRPTRWVHIRLRLLTLPAEVQARAETGLLSALNIEAILAIDDPVQQIKAAEAICQAKENGKTKFLNVRRRFRYRRSKEQMNQMAAVMLNRGIKGIGPRSLVWAAGYITDDELMLDIQRATPRKFREQFREILENS